MGLADSASFPTENGHVGHSHSHLTTEATFDFDGAPSTNRSPAKRHSQKRRVVDLTNEDDDEVLEDTPRKVPPERLHLRSFAVSICNVDSLAGSHVLVIVTLTLQ